MKVDPSALASLWNTLAKQFNISIGASGLLSAGGHGLLISSTLPGAGRSVGVSCHLHLASSSLFSRVLSISFLLDVD